MKHQEFLHWICSVNYREKTPLNSIATYTDILYKPHWLLQRYITPITFQPDVSFAILNFSFCWEWLLLFPKMGNMFLPTLVKVIPKSTGNLISLLCHIFNRFSKEMRVSSRTIPGLRIPCDNGKMLQSMHSANDFPQCVMSEVLTLDFFNHLSGMNSPHKMLGLNYIQTKLQHLKLKILGYIRIFIFNKLN